MSTLEEKGKIELYRSKINCCACGACLNICPKKAISMANDEYGFTYPVINFDLCVNCQLCKKVCSFQNVLETNIPIESYAASRKNPQEILKSSSGGIFAAIADKIIEENGIVFGSTMEYTGHRLEVKHIGVDKKDELIKLFGSKYVQSYIGDTYNEAKEHLESNRIVLFSGTPCQIAGLKLFLGKKYGNLLTIDIICHGVPSVQMFQDYIKCIEENLKCKIEKFTFRDKKFGWGLNGSFTYIKKEEKYEEKFECDKSSYYKMFLESHIYRESCYNCKYTSKHRPADITIGDYWGVEKEHPQIFNSGSGKLDLEKGISCVIVNTVKGKEYFEKYSDVIDKYESTFEKISKNNAQLNCSSKSDKRNEILDKYKEFGYSYLEKEFQRKLMYYKLLKLVPKKLKTLIKKILLRK